MVSSTAAKITFQRIFVPTDFSDISQRALDYAKSIARQYGSEILLAHVSQPIYPVGPPEGSWIDETEILQRREQQLEQMGAELRSEGFNGRSISAAGLLEDELMASVQREKVDLIVLGTHGKTGLARFLFGSDAEDLLRHASSPVLVVGPAAVPAGAQAWHPRDVLCASDLDPNAASIAAFAFMLASGYQAAFTLLHVEDSARKVNGEDFAQFERALIQLMPEDHGPIPALHTLLTDKISGHAIVKLAQERNSDLIVIGAHRASSAATHLMRGIAPQVFAEASCPVMVLQEP